MMLMIKHLLKFIRDKNLHWIVICEQHNAFYARSVVVDQFPFNIIRYLFSNRVANISPPLTLVGMDRQLFNVVKGKLSEMYITTVENINDPIPTTPLRIFIVQKGFFDFVCSRFFDLFDFFVGFNA